MPGTVVTLAAGVAAALYLVRLLWRLSTALHRFHDLVTHELNANDGGSMKDDLGALREDVAALTAHKEAAHELLQQQVDHLAHLVESHHPTTHNHHRGVTDG
jgi:hypothetical protein